MGRWTVTCAGLGLGAAMALSSGPARAQVQCEPPGGFAAWIDSFKRYAVAQGISQRTASAALDGLTLNAELQPLAQALSSDHEVSIPIEHLPIRRDGALLL